jgi:hypothetical protein
MGTITDLPTRVIGMHMQAYLMEKEFDSRSTIVQVMEGGGEVQKFMDEGFSMFSGNAATKRGSAFDSIVMGICEGKGFGEQISIPPPDVLGSNGSRSTKAYKEWEAKQTGVVCSEDEAWRYQRMLDSMRGTEAAWELVTLTKQTQASYFAEIDGHPVKVRPDGECDELWWDLKTTSSQWSKLARSVKDFHYGEQEWLYREVAKVFGVPHFRMPFVFVSTTPPFGCKVFLLPEDYVEECGVRMRATMELMRLRRSTGEYLPLDHGEVQELAIPEWVRRTEEVY